MKKTLLMAICVIGAAGLASVHAQLINVQFLDDSINRNGNATTDEGSPIPLPVMTGPAIFGSAGDQWNGVTSNLLAYTGFPNGAHTTNSIPLNYSDGTPSGVSMTLSTPGGTYNANSVAWSHHSTFSWPSLAAEQAAPANQNAGTYTPYSALMQTCTLCGQNALGSVTLTGLTVGQGYNVVVYTATDESVAGGRQGQYTINGQAQSYVWDGVTTNLVAHTDYLEFIGVAPDATGKIVISFGGPNGETDFDGFQLQVAAAGPLPSQILNLNPNGSQFFNAVTNFKFTISSASSGGAQLPTNPTNQIHVNLNGNDVSSTLQFSGSNTYWNVTVPGIPLNVGTNTVSIVVTNSADLISSNSVTFDTYNPAIVIPVETYDFNGGLHIDNFVPTNAPGGTSYWGVTGISNVDYSMVAGSGVAGGGTTLAPNYPDRGDSNVAFQVPNDLNLPLYQAQSNAAIYNVNLAYNNAGNWFNYTRNTWPSGYYVAYARVSSGNGTPGGIGNYEALNLLTSGFGTANQTTNNLGYFIISDGLSWNNYSWVPLTDSSGNLVPVSVPSGQQTLQLLSGGGLNVIDFMFVAVPTNGFKPVINNLNPALTTENDNIFVSNKLTFSVSSLFSTVANSDIHTYLNGTDVSASQTFTGNNTNWSVTVPVSLPANQINQTFVISAKDANGLTNQVSGTFDTFSQSNFMIEAGDFDFNGGQWIDDPIETATNVVDSNSYYYYPGGNPANAAVYGVDFTTTNLAGEAYVYRFDGSDTSPGGFDAAGTEVTSDMLRNKFVNTGQVPNEDIGTTNTDVDVGWNAPGTWLNYTRTFPTNTYNVWGRLAAGASYTNATMSLVTSGQGTTNQTTQVLGNFADTNANGFQSWHWVPLTDANGQPVAVSLGGVETLKVTAPSGSAGGSLNEHFYMFVPSTAVSPFSISASVSAGTVSIKFPTQSAHSYTVQYSGSLNPASWQTLIGGSGIAGDGTVHTVTDTTGGAQRFYRVEVQ